jgi:hypothetical protein
MASGERVVNSCKPSFADSAGMRVPWRAQSASAMKSDTLSVARKIARNDSNSATLPNRV